MTNMTTDPAQVALSIRQLLVELILPGRKTIEVCSWPIRHRGPLWLHAGMTRERGLLRRFGLDEQQLTFGALVGGCELTDCIAFTPATCGTMVPPPSQSRPPHRNAVRLVSGKPDPILASPEVDRQSVHGR